MLLMKLLNCWLYCNNLSLALGKWEEEDFCSVLLALGQAGKQK